MSFVLGIDIGGTNVRLGLVRKTYGLSDFIQLKTESVFKSSDPIDDLSRIINDYLKTYGVNKHILAVSIGFPSTIDKDAKVVLSTPNIPSLQNIQVVDELFKRLNLPIYISRDVNLLMLFDIYQLKINAAGVLLGFYFGTGIGNAIFIDGLPLRGKNGVTAELGHIPMVNDHSLCTCGNIGCLENHASGRYLQTLVNNELKQTSISEIFTVHSQHPKVMNFIENMAIAVALEVSILDPECIILGGGVLQMKDFPKKIFIERIKDRTRKPLPSENLEIIYAPNGQINGIIGAGIYAFKLLNTV